MPSQVPQAVIDLAQNMRSKVNPAVNQILRGRIPHGSDFMALRASAGRLDAAGVLQQIERAVQANDPALLDGLTADGLACFGTSLLGTVNGPQDLAKVAMALRASRMLGCGFDADANYNTRRHHDRIDVQTHLMNRDFDYVESLLDDLVDDGDLQWGARVELAHPVHGREGSDWKTWLGLFNEPLVEHNLAPIALLDNADGNDFDRLYVPQELPTVDDGPLVTIVMSVFSPNQSLITALRSLAAQTWRNIEVLVVDDCSPEEFWPLIESAVATDERFTLHRMPENGGTYKIRNYALSVAKGEYLTFQDSDDWSHPLRIERQVKALLEDPQAVASYSSALRVMGDLSVQATGFRSVRRNISSMMIRLGDVVPVLGRFDAVRKSADSEFTDRLRTVFGVEREVFVDEPLAVVQLTQGSLSRDEFKFGWRHPERVMYRQAFEFWHEQIAQGLASPMMPEEGRPFPAPPMHLQREGYPQEFDVAVVGDWRNRIEGVEYHAQELAALSDAGLKVGVLSTESMRATRARRIFVTHGVGQLAYDGKVTIVSWEGDVHADVVVVREAELLRMPRDPQASTVKAKRVLIVADRAPRAPKGKWLTYDPADAEQNARDAFGCEPQWVAGCAAIADQLRAEGAKADISVQPWGRFDQSPSKHGRLGRRVHVGMIDLPVQRRDRLDERAYDALLPRDSRFTVVLRDEQAMLSSREGIPPLPEQWSVDTQTPVDQLVAGLDVLVLAPRKTSTPVITPGVVTALARGVLLVAPQQYAAILGAAATYVAKGQDPTRVFEALADDRKRADQLRQNGYDLLRTWAETGGAVKIVKSAISHT